MEASKQIYLFISVSESDIMYKLLQIIATLTSMQQQIWIVTLNHELQ